MRRHNRSFFGQKSGLIFDSGDWDIEYAYLTCIKKNPEKGWEKPSLGQGKKIKLNLGEIIMIRRVLMGVEDRWSTVHKFNDEQSTIGISRDKTNHEQIWVNINSYSKNIRPPETEIFLMLLVHVINEKIENATTNSKKFDKNEKNMEQIESNNKEFYCKTIST